MFELKFNILLCFEDLMYYLHQFEVIPDFTTTIVFPYKICDIFFHTLF